ncbi:MAG: cation:proton antiporter [Candidatus Euphemobacter frigidus]|nr:cation:proton antiporter [Candidatus Euphemobacter frigidus]MDP8276124.1 cation:proton antiporter [Candidatus Euphemobacter frigidus]
MKTIIIISTVIVACLLPFGDLYAQTLEDDAGLAERMATLVFQIAIILIATWAGEQIFKKLRLPIILGELVAGIIIGPFLLGAIPLPGFADGLFSITVNFPVSYELYGFATVASIVLLFLIGLETDINTFLRFSVAGSFIGTGGMVISFLLGDLVTVWFSRMVFGTVYGFADPIPLFLGVVSTATSVGISATILSEKRKIDSPEGVTILSAAIIDDVLGIILLAIIIGVIKSGDVQWGTIGWIAGRAIGVWLGFMLLGLFFARRISAGLKRFKETNTIAVMSFALALLLAGIFEKSGLAMIIGAYIMGLTLSKTDLTYLLQAKLSIFYRFFVPVFFCVMGMLIDVRALFNEKILLFALVYSLLAAAAKLTGSGLPALLLNFNLRGAARIGLGMMPRCEVALIIAGIGLSSGILPSDAFSVVIIMTVLTSLIAPSIFSRMIDQEGQVLRKPTRVKSDKKHITYDFPNRETAELLLAKIIDAFRHEGFYVHLLDIRRHLYAIRKEDTFITMRYSPRKIVFDCREEDVSFIHTLFYEALAELQRIMRHLQSLTDRKTIGERIFEEPVKTAPRVNGKEKALLSRMFVPDGMEYNLPGKNKNEILEELVRLFIDSKQLPPERYNDALLMLLDRERDISTGMQDGIAFPHARTDIVHQLITVVGVKKEGVDFNSFDGQPAYIFVATLIPEGKPKPYLKLTAVLSRFLSVEENRERMIACRSNRELYMILRELS